MQRRRRRRRRRLSVPAIITLVVTVGLVVLMFTVRPFDFFWNIGEAGMGALEDVTTSDPNVPITTTGMANTPPTTITPTPEPMPSVERIRLASVGDVMNHDAIFGAALTEEGEGDAQGSYDFNPFFSEIKSYLGDADLTFANFESPVRPDRAVHGYSRFNAPVAYAEAVKAAGVDYVSLANNHILDTYVDGAIATMNSMDQVGLGFAGTGRSQEEFDKTVMIDKGNIKIAFLSYTTSTNGMEADVDQEKLPYTVKYFDEDKIVADIGKAKTAGADVVLLALHWGTEYDREPSDGQVTQAKAFCDAGADVILGCHPHVLQPMERYLTEDGRNALILYSQGNFLSNQTDQYQDTGAIFYFDIEKDLQNGNVVVDNVEYLPTWVWKYEADNKDNFRVVPAGSYRNDDLGSRSETRMLEAFEETTDLLGDTVGTPLEG